MMRHRFTTFELLPAGKSESGYVDPQEPGTQGVSVSCSGSGF